jgi:hypothetical protein
MSSELLYTSAPQGLKGGSRGFTTVLCTAGMPPNLADKLESFSGYKHVYSPQDPLAEHNPVRFAYLRPNVGGRSVTVVSRLAAYGVDYSGRSNKLAHHIVLEAEERPHGGPAWLLSQKDLWKASWNGECKTLNAGPRIPEGDKVAGVCRQWREMADDAGWGGQLVTWLKQSNKPIWLIYEPKQQGQILELLVESLALLPEAERWKYTFATYFSGLPGDVDCRIRGVVTGSDEARLASARGHVIDLTHPVLLTTTSAWIEFARTGIFPSTPLAISAAPELPSGSDAVLGVREAPSLSEFISVETPWRDEPQRMSKTSLPVDLPHRVGEYQLAPPPMPTTSRSSQPPTLPNQKNGRDSTSSIFRWALPAAAVVVLLMILGAGISAFRDSVAWSLSSSKVSPGASQQEPNKPERQTKTEANVDHESPDAGSEEIESKPKIATTEVQPHPPMLEISLVSNNADEEVVQTWSKESDSVFKVSINENWKGVTNYRLKLPENLTARLDPRDSCLTINDESKIVLSKEQDYESDEWKGIPKKLELLIEGDGTEYRISLVIELSNETRKVQAKELKLQMNISENITKPQIDVRKVYENELDEVEGFKFNLIDAGESKSEVEGKYGRITQDGEVLVYKVDIDRVFSANQLDSVDFFDYQVSCDNEVPASQGKIRIEIHNPLRFNWLAAKTVDGSDLRFEREVVKRLFQSEGEYEVYFKQGNSLIGEAAVLRMIVLSGRILLADKQNLTVEGVGSFTLDPNSKDKNKIEFSDSNALRRHLESLFIESHLFRNVCEEQITQELMRKRENILSLEKSANHEQNPGQKKKIGDDLSRLREDKDSVESLRKRVTDIIQRRKNIRDARSLEDLLNQNAEVFVNELINEMEAKNSCAKAVLEQCRQETLNRFNQAKDYVRSCQLIVVKKVDGSSADKNKNPSAGTKEIPYPPSS